MNRPRTLITGGAGFLGSHLCDYYLAKGHHVVCVDNLITGSLDNVAHLFGKKEFEFLQHDVTTYLYAAGPVDNVLHFASPASPIDFERYPIQVLKAGGLGTHNALGFARAKGARFLLASTSEVYGDPQVHPQPESYWGNVNPIGIRGVYDEAKRYAEALTMAYHRVHDVDTRIVRIFNTFGPRMRFDDGRVLPTFLAQALQNEPLTVFGTGEQTRSFCYVDDLISGIDLLLESGEHQPINLGNPHEITIRELAEEVIELTGSDSELSFHPLPPDDPKVRQPDIGLAQSVLGWDFKVSRAEGIRKTMEDFKNRLAKAEQESDLQV